jgi:hypothetical protein
MSFPHDMYLRCQMIKYVLSISWFCIIHFHHYLINFYKYIRKKYVNHARKDLRCHFEQTIEEIIFILDMNHKCNRKGYSWVSKLYVRNGHLTYLIISFISWIVISFSQFNMNGCLFSLSKQMFLVILFVHFLFGRRKGK